MLIPIDQIRRAKAGDQAAVDALFCAHRKRIQDFAVSGTCFSRVSRSFTALTAGRPIRSGPSPIVRYAWIRDLPACPRRNNGDTVSRP